MQTDELISLMATSSQPVDTGWLRRATWLAALVAMIAATIAVLLTLGARRDLAGAWASAPVLGKVLLGASVAGIAVAVFQRSLRPGLRPRGHLSLILLPIAAVMLWALVVLARAPGGEWASLTFGRSWQACLISVVLYGLIPFAAMIAIARRGAPVDLRLTGAAAGVASAALATIAYSVHCPEDTIPFIASWYPLAMAIMAAVGALAFPRFVRW